MKEKKIMEILMMTNRHLEEVRLLGFSVYGTRTNSDWQVNNNLFRKMLPCNESDFYSMFSETNFDKRIIIDQKSRANRINIPSKDDWFIDLSTANVEQQKSQTGDGSTVIEVSCDIYFDDSFKSLGYRHIKATINKLPITLQLLLGS